MTMGLAVVFVIFVLSVSLLPALRSEPSAAPVATVDVAAASDLVGSGSHHYLDVRTDEEFKKGHLENSLNVPYLFFTPQGREKNPQFIEQVVASGCDKEDNIIVGCQSGIRSQLACADLMAAGFKNIKDMEGGYAAWVGNGLAVKKPQAHEEL